MSESAEPAPESSSPVTPGPTQRTYLSERDRLDVITKLCYVRGLLNKSEDDLSCDVLKAASNCLAVKWNRQPPAYRTIRDIWAACVATGSARRVKAGGRPPGAKNKKNKQKDSEQQEEQEQEKEEKDKSEQESDQEEGKTILAIHGTRLLKIKLKSP